jgi:ATP-dependent helicase/nuclease subunit A
MSEPGIIALPLPDAPARMRIQAGLDTCLLVEAGAGSGKTSELVNRMVALVASGTTTVDHIAAVTFTRKAAGELRERLQAGLEERLRARGPGGPGVEERARLRQALEEIDRAFVGTIHAFCSRLLRERPMEVGLDPAFQELPAEDRVRIRRQFWEAYLERLVRDAHPALEEMSEAGLRPGQLFGLFDRLVENPDVRFPAPEATPPSASEIGSIRKALRAIVEQGRELMDDREPSGGWDRLQRKIRTAAFTLDVTGWKRRSDFFEALELLCTQSKKGHTITLKRWKNSDLAKGLKAKADAFGHGDTAAQRLLDRWYAHRYALAVRLVHQAAEDFAEHRRRSGRLDFQDLLVLAARLLRESGVARQELGLRYRYLLVDEFQDTDPLQAEILFLLASEPDEERQQVGGAEAGGRAESDGSSEADAPSSPGDWRSAVPRPGALFVVGDPKQSIYRFRRADIQLYELVKTRFAEFGEVLELNANFRSRPPIGDLVNEVFDRDEFFPPEATAEQARFEPLNTRPKERSAPAEGVYWYAVEPERSSNAAVAEDDAARVATWIGDRIADGERSPGDFLVLTRVTRSLAVYARALEARSIPVQVTGAGVGVEQELQELLILLECMIDPTDPVKVVSVLVGLFFGMDFESLVAHRLAKGRFDVLRPGESGHPEVLAGLRKLNRWWMSASREPADLFLGRLVPELGLLPFAAAGELGSIRAGALIYALDAVRAAALSGDASLPGALDALRSALELKEAEAPLEPARPDVVRLMNLHQAKGLEAPVVVLADPSKPPHFAPAMHVERDGDGAAAGYLRVVEQGRAYRNTVLARPVDWPAKEEAETRFEDAEQVRLLYVAVTRARDELVVARWVAKPELSPWAPLDPWLLGHADELPVVARDPDPREELGVSPGEIAGEIGKAAARLDALTQPSFRHASVTEIAKMAATASDGTEAEAPTREEAGAFRGYSWGSAVHGALAAAAVDDSEAALRASSRELLVEHSRPLDDHGEPVELEELIALVRAVRASELWQRARASPKVLVEVPFAAPGITRPVHRPEEEVPAASRGDEGTPGQRQLDLFGETVGASGASEGETTQGAPDAPEQDPLPTVLEGVIDLAFREADGWVIADYKTDVGTDPDFPRRLETYRRQVDLYAEAWTRLTGDPVTQRVLFFTTQGRAETW